MFLRFLILGSLIGASSLSAKSWQGSAGASYSSDFTGASPLASFYLGFSQPLNKTVTLGMNQGVNKKFYIYPDEDEFSLSDTSLYVSNSLGEWLMLSHSLSFSFSLPVSKYSRENEKYTNLKLGWAGAHKILSDKLGLSYGISGIAYLSKYQSSVSNDGLGGTPLPVYSLGISHGGSYGIIDKLSASYSLSLNRIWYYELDPEAGQDPVVVSDITDEVYSVSMQLSYAIEHGLTLSLGTSKGNLITQVGTLDLAFFDEDLSQYYISLGYLF